MTHFNVKFGVTKKHLILFYMMKHQITLMVNIQKLVKAILHQK